MDHSGGIESDALFDLNNRISNELLVSVFAFLFIHLLCLSAKLFVFVNGRDCQLRVTTVSVGLIDTSLIVARYSLNQINWARSNEAI